MDPHKVNAITHWKTPTNADLLCNFLGTVGFLAPNVPQIRIPMGHLNKLIEKNAPYNWTTTMDRAFEKVKELVQAFRECHRIPIDYSPDAEAINLVTDACLTGIGGLVSQGNNWQTANVVAFYSAKLSATQQNYPVHDKEFLAGLETMLWHCDILQGAHFRWFTDHKALEYFLTQDKLSLRQSRWLEKITDFDFMIHYIPGQHNILADTLSRIYKGDLPGTIRAPSEFSIEDPDLQDFKLRKPILIPLSAAPMTFSSNENAYNGFHTPPPPAANRPHLSKKVYLRLPPSKSPAQRAATPSVPGTHPAPNPVIPCQNIDAHIPMVSPSPDTTPVVNPASPLLSENAKLQPSNLLDTLDSAFEFPACIKNKYIFDPYFREVQLNPAHYKNFEITDGLMYHKTNNQCILCVPKIVLQNRTTHEILIEHAHSLLTHLGA